MEYSHVFYFALFSLAPVLFADDEDEFDTDVDTDDMLEDSDSLDELGDIESDDDPGVEWRSDAEYEE